MDPIVKKSFYFSIYYERYSMSDKIKALSEAEKAELETIRRNFARKTAEIGQAEITLTLMQEQKEDLLKEYNEIRQKETQFLEGLRSSYGEGYLDVEEKTYHTID